MLNFILLGASIALGVTIATIVGFAIVLYAITNTRFMRWYIRKYMNMIKAIENDETFL